MAILFQQQHVSNTWVFTLTQLATIQRISITDLTPSSAQHTSWQLTYHAFQGSHITSCSEWLSVHVFSLPVNMSGYRFPPRSQDDRDKFGAPVRHHIKYLTRRLRTQLTWSMWSEVHDEINSPAPQANTSKAILMAARLQTPGRPLHVVLHIQLMKSDCLSIVNFFCTSN